MKYILADIGIEVNLKYELAIRRMKDYQSEFGGTHIRINIEYDNNIQLPPYVRRTVAKFNYNWLEFENGDFGVYRKSAPDYVSAFARWNKNATELTLKLADVSSTNGYPMDFREFSYIGELLQIILPYHGRTVLHSSAIELDGHGIAFSAPSGTGKSTHTTMWRSMFDNCNAINDDTPIIYNNGKGFLLCGSPWSGKTEINANICAPLDAVVCIYQDRENHIEKISPRVSMPLLLNEIRSSAFAERENLKFSILTDLLSTTDIYRLGCLPNEEAVITCKEKIWKEL